MASDFYVVSANCENLNMFISEFDFRSFLKPTMCKGLGVIAIRD